MNIFYLDSDPKLCAQAHCDKHVVKMILEYSQLMCTTHRTLDSPSELHTSMYKVTHQNHPSRIWAGQSEENYKWLYDLWFWTCKEYWWRYGKIHKTWEKLYNIVSHIPQNISTGSFTPPPQCMPDHCKKSDTVDAYRNYYMTEKATFAKWGGTDGEMREPPNWFVV